MKRPVAILVLAALTFLIVWPPMTEQILQNDQLEVAFRYPSSNLRPAPIIDETPYFFAGIILQFIAIVSSTALLQRQKWAWLFAIASHLTVMSVHLAANLSVERTGGFEFISHVDGSFGRYVSLIIGAASLYLLMRKDVKVFLGKIKRVDQSH
ncbi:MAG TPA: hypothetical protein VJ742_08790 [Nitrososphaera sp.]|nr:hypothetical protein [Nitrososphaera sp.]